MITIIGLTAIKYFEYYSLSFQVILFTNNIM